MNYLGTLYNKQRILYFESPGCIAKLTSVRWQNFYEQDILFYFLLKEEAKGEGTLSESFLKVDNYPPFLNLSPKYLFYIIKAFIIFENTLIISLCMIL